MRMRNCPYCFGTGNIGRGHRCSFCHGKKKIGAEYCKWFLQSKNKHSKTFERIKSKYELIMREETDKIMQKWIDENPAPRKFPKK